MHQNCRGNGGKEKRADSIINKSMLSLHSDYSREDLHDIFSPDTLFSPQGGTVGHCRSPVPAIGWADTTTPAIQADGEA